MERIMVGQSCRGLEKNLERRDRRDKAHDKRNWQLFTKKLVCKILSKEDLGKLGK